MLPTVPLPRRPLHPSDPVRQWYENELGWATVPGSPLRLASGLRFDVLDIPAEAGVKALRHLGPASPVALHGSRSAPREDPAARREDPAARRGKWPARCGARMWLLVAAGSAEELPGLLDWLEWGALALDLTAIGAGGSIEAPLPPGVPEGPLTADDAGAGADGPGGSGPQGAAVWLRPPEPGCEVEPSLPTLSAVGGDGGAPDLVRVVDTVATQCHRVRLRRACAQPSAYS
ncbi:SCO3374 family protein [Streptomyces sp. NBC_01340]|uniref:SCO3374 family protein n=1 Tax=unclassified Streptomyces TaxID=2593676 RepID=UPI00225312A3|nr:MULTISPECIES: SCO3374 family protein [unclassified Streptomyces]MCX4455890.1 SCO3374 family protein [Streptomyces sp. NBC_01719]MCX4495250.1 SCO3374 family protein [Streptomyces sp. NBC_01728]WSI40219.1 SCO3374 family protein [Streptomyces sp. NBC_01340]